MSSFIASSAYRPSAGLRTFIDEASALVQALLSPGKIIREVEEMQALHVQANRIEASDPATAAILRRRASRIGLR